MASLISDAALQLPGPEWVQQRRSRAIAELEATPLPSVDDEMWRYTPVGEIDLTRYGAAPVPDPPTEAVLHHVGELAALVRIVDGHVLSIELGDEAAAAGLEVLSAGALDGAEAWWDDLVADDAFDLVNAAFSAEPILVSVPSGRTIPGVVHVEHHLSRPDIISAPHLVVRVGANADVAVLESHRGDAAALVVPRTDFSVAADARFRYAVVQQTGEAVTHIARQRTVAGSQSSVALAAVTLGGGFARLRSDCRLDGRGADATMLGASLGRHDQVIDFRTFQDHAAPDTTSELLYKNVVDDRARVITTGLIRVEPEARGTVAQQTNRTIKLGPDAWAESVPNLEIETNDVRCSHASSVGPIGEDESFYLASRGVPPEIAERLIVTGFLDEVLRRLGDDTLAAELRSTISDRLRAGSTR